MPADSGAPIGFQSLFASYFCNFHTEIFQTSLFSCCPRLEVVITPDSSVRSAERLCILAEGPLRVTECLSGLQESARQELLVTPGRLSTTHSWGGHERRDAFSLFGQEFSSCNADVESERWVRALLDPAHSLVLVIYSPFMGNVC